MNAPASEPQLAPELINLLAALRPKANSLIVSIFGDAIMPRGGAIWLGDLVRLMALFGLSERHVRTGVYRLSQEGWLSSKTEGRRARYSLSEDGFKRFADASQRIYAHGEPEASGEWTLVQGFADLSQSERQNLRRTLRWQGFGQLSTSLMALPSSPPPGLMLELEQAGLARRVLVFSSQIAATQPAENLSAAAAAAWPLDALNTDYETFVRQFSALQVGNMPLSGENAFALRVLLIHEYRRILLKDPHLAEAFLPANWAGPAARDLSAEIYRQTVAPAENWLTDTVSEPASSSPPAGSHFWQRFGGVDLSAASS